MKKFLSASTAVLKAGLAAKDLVGTVLNPVASLRDFVKKTVIKSMVFIIKKGINLGMKDKVSADSNIIVQQLNALTDTNADVSKIHKNIQFKVTLDNLIEEVEEVDEYKVLRFIDLTKAKNKLSAYKNSLRNDVYEYISEDSFKNINSLVESANKILRMPTELVGCEFVNCQVTVASHDLVKHDFELTFNVLVCLKSST